MSLTSWWYDPWEDFALLRRQMDNLFEESSRRRNQPQFVQPQLQQQQQQQLQTQWIPVWDINEHDNYYRVHMELPGVKQEDVEITITGNNLLTITGEKKIHEKHEGVKSLREERRCGHFTRVINLPTSIDRENIEAVFHDGMLHITIPKAVESVSPRKIPLKGVQPGHLEAGQEPGMEQKQQEQVSVPLSGEVQEASLRDQTVSPGLEKPDVLQPHLQPTQVPGEQKDQGEQFLEEYQRGQSQGLQQVPGEQKDQGEQFLGEYQRGQPLKQEQPASEVPPPPPMPQEKFPLGQQQGELESKIPEQAEGQQQQQQIPVGRSE